MDSLEKKIRNKLEIRQFAQEGLGLSADNNTAVFVNHSPNEGNLELNVSFPRLNDALDKAWRSSRISTYAPIISNRKVIGPAIVFLKRAVRKLLHIFMRWYIEPILRKQNEFNEQILQAVKISTEIVQTQYSESATKLQTDIGNMRTDIGSLQMDTDNTRTAISNLQMDTDNTRTAISNLQMDTGNTRAVISNLQTDINTIHRNMRNQISSVEDLKELVSSLDEYLNAIRQMDFHQQSLLVAEQSEQLLSLSKSVRYLLSSMNIHIDLNMLNAPPIDYMDFENKFRGPREVIKAWQTPYIKYFEHRGGGEILDIGCGRGEFLELMWDNNIPGYGIDVYPPFVEFCSDRGFRVQQADALEHLNSLEDSSLGGIFMSQVVEHLAPDYILALIRTAYKKLKPGCHFIMITPNPQSLATYANFYIDLSHMKPVHYATLEYLLKAANFQHVERYNPPETLYGARLSHCETDNAENIDIINNHVFSHLDYTIIARK